MTFTGSTKFPLDFDDASTLGPEFQDAIPTVDPIYNIASVFRRNLNKTVLSIEERLGILGDSSTTSVDWGTLTISGIPNQGLRFAGSHVEWPGSLSENGIFLDSASGDPAFHKSGEPASTFYLLTGGSGASTWDGIYANDKEMEISVVTGGLPAYGLKWTQVSDSGVGFLLDRDKTSALSSDAIFKVQNRNSNDDQPAVYAASVGTGEVVLVEVSSTGLAAAANQTGQVIRLDPNAGDDPSATYLGLAFETDSDGDAEKVATTVSQNFDVGFISQAPKNIISVNSDTLEDRLQINSSTVNEILTPSAAQTAFKISLSADADDLDDSIEHRAILFDFARNLSPATAYGIKNEASELDYMIHSESGKIWSQVSGLTGGGHPALFVTSDSDPDTMIGVLSSGTYSSPSPAFGVRVDHHAEFSYTSPAIIGAVSLDFDHVEVNSISSGLNPDPGDAAYLNAVYIAVTPHINDGVSSTPGSVIITGQKIESLNNDGEAERRALWTGPNWTYALAAESGLIDLTHTATAGQSHVTVTTTTGSLLSGESAVGQKIQLVPGADASGSFIVGLSIPDFTDAGSAQKFGIVIGDPTGDSNFDTGLIVGGTSSSFSFKGTPPAASSAFWLQNLQTDLNAALNANSSLVGVHIEMTPDAGDASDSQTIAFDAYGNGASGGTTMAFQVAGTWDYAFKGDVGLVELAHTLPDSTATDQIYSHMIQTVTGGVATHDGYAAVGHNVGITSGGLDGQGEQSTIGQVVFVTGSADDGDPTGTPGFGANLYGILTAFGGKNGGIAQATGMRIGAFDTALHLDGGKAYSEFDSPSISALTGTVTVTTSTALTGSGTQFTTELAVGDYVWLPSGQYERVVSITDNLNAVMENAWLAAEGPVAASVTTGEPDSFVHHDITTRSGGMVLASGGSSFLFGQRLALAPHASDVAGSVIVGQYIPDFTDAGSATKAGLVIGDPFATQTSNFGIGLAVAVGGQGAVVYGTDNWFWQKTTPTKNETSALSGIADTDGNALISSREYAAVNGIAKPAGDAATGGPEDGTYAGVRASLNGDNGSTSATRVAFWASDVGVNESWDYLLLGKSGAVNLEHTLPDQTGAGPTIQTHFNVATTSGVLNPSSGTAQAYAHLVTMSSDGMTDADATIIGNAVAISDNASDSAGEYVGSFIGGFTRTGSGGDSFAHYVWSGWDYSFKANAGLVDLTHTLTTQDALESHLTLTTTGANLTALDAISSSGLLQITSGGMTYNGVTTTAALALTVSGASNDDDDSRLVGIDVAPLTRNSSFATATALAVDSDWDYVIRSQSGVMEMSHSIALGISGISKHIYLQTDSAGLTAASADLFGIMVDMDGHSTDVTGSEIIGVTFTGSRGGGAQEATRTAIDVDIDWDYALRTSSGKVSTFTTDTAAAVTHRQDGTGHILELRDGATPRFQVADEGVTTLTASSTSTALTIRQDSTGDILEVKDGGTSVMTVTDGGITSFSVNSASTALTVNQASTGDIFELTDGGLPVFTVADGGNSAFTVNSASLACEIRQDGAGDLLAVKDGVTSRFAVSHDGKINVLTTTAVGSEAVNIYQDDEDQPYIKFDGWAASDESRSISTINGSDTDMLRMDVKGTTRWVPAYGSAQLTDRVVRSGSTSTTSATNVVVPSMTMSPGIGKYLVWFAGSASNDTANTATNLVIAAGTSGSPSVVSGSLQQTRMSDGTTNDRTPFCCTAEVTLTGGSDVIEGHFYTQTGTTTNAYVYDANLMYLRIG